MNKLLGSYKNGTYRVYLWEDGTKVRETADDVFEADRPECVDVTISTKCNNKCLYCYMGCTPDGRWADYKRYKFINNLPRLLEMNINLNFPINPDLNEFLDLVIGQGVIVNATVNAKHFIQNNTFIRGLIDSGKIHGLGISYNISFADEMIEKIKDIPNAVVHVIAGCITKKDIKKLRGKGLKLLILGFKNIGRGENYYNACRGTIEENMTWLEKELPKMVGDFDAIAFDNLALEQLHVKNWIDPETWEERYLGPDAQTSFYIDLTHGFYAPSSLSDDHRMIRSKSLQEMFDDIRGKT